MSNAMILKSIEKSNNNANLCTNVERDGYWKYENCRITQKFEDRRIGKTWDLPQFPFFNTSPQMIKLFDILKPHHPLFSTITRADIYGEFYGSEPYKDKRIRDLFSRLLELCHDYLAQCELEKKEHVKRLTLDQLYLRELENSFNSVIKDARKTSCARNSG